MTPVKLWISLAAGVVISAVAMVLAFRNVPLSELAVYFRSIDIRWTSLSVILVVTSFAIRAYRWKLIVETTAHLPYWQAFHPLMIGFMMNCILPGRVGEVARPAILKKNNSIPFSTGLATVATERVLDALVLILLFAWMMATVRIDSSLQMTFGDVVLNRDTLVRLASGTVKLSIVLILGILMISIDVSRNWICGVVNRLPVLAFGHAVFRHFLENRISRPMTRIIHHIASGFELIKSPAKLAQCVILSLLIWGIAGLSYYTMSLGSPGIGLGPMEIMIVMIIVCFFIAIPSVPGFWGIWEAGGVFALSLFGISASDAAGFTLANHAVQMFPVILVGLISVMITGINIFHLSREAQTV